LKRQREETNRPQQLNSTTQLNKKTKQDPEPLLPPTLASDVAATWNGAVDAMLGPAVRALAKRGL
jgi:hypothetical protein